MGSELELQPGTWTVGGAEDDGIRFPGLPPRLLELDVEPDRTWVDARGRCGWAGRCSRPACAAGCFPESRSDCHGRRSMPDRATDEAAGNASALVRSLLEPGGAPVSSAAAALVCVAGPDAGAVFLLARAQARAGALPPAARSGSGTGRSRAAISSSCSTRWHPSGHGTSADETERGVSGRGFVAASSLSDGDLLAVGRSLLHYRRASPDAVGPGDTASVDGVRPWSAHRRQARPLHQQLHQTAVLGEEAREVHPPAAAAAPRRPSPGRGRMSTFRMSRNAK